LTSSYSLILNFSPGNWETWEGKKWRAALYKFSFTPLQKRRKKKKKDVKKGGKKTHDWKRRGKEKGTGERNAIGERVKFPSRKGPRENERTSLLFPLDSGN